MSYCVCFLGGKRIKKNKIYKLRKNLETVLYFRNNFFNFIFSGKEKTSTPGFATFATF